MPVLKSNQINEFAFPKKKFEDKALYESEKIIEHILKCLYCKYYNTGNINVNHWKSEIKGWLIWYMKHDMKISTPKSRILWKYFVTYPGYDTIDKFTYGWDLFLEEFGYKYDFMHRPCTKIIHNNYLEIIGNLLSHIDNKNIKEFSNTIKEI